MTIPLFHCATETDKRDSTQPVEVPVWLPHCGHSGCKGCVLQHFADCQDAGEPVRSSLFSRFAVPAHTLTMTRTDPLSQARCPVCSAGPLSERELAALQHADGARPTQGAGSQGYKNNNKGQGKKAGYTVEKVETSSPGSTHSMREVLTLIDSDEEDDEEEDDEKAPSPKKQKVEDAKGKGKATVDEITLDSSSDEGGGSGSGDDEDGDEYEPSPPPRSARIDDDDEDEEMGVVDSDSDVGGVGGPSTRRGGGGAAPLASSDFRSSTKLDALVKSLAAAKAKDPGLKAVVFSQVRSGVEDSARALHSLRWVRCELTALCCGPTVHGLSRLDRARHEPRRFQVRLFRGSSVRDRHATRATDRVDRHAATSASTAP